MRVQVGTSGCLQAHAIMTSISGPELVRSAKLDADDLATKTHGETTRGVGVLVRDQDAAPRCGIASTASDRLGERQLASNGLEDVLV